VKHRLAASALVLALCAPAAAQDAPMSALAPADEYFGHYKLSVLGIANTIRDVGRRLEDGRDATAMIYGPLAFVTDAIRDWERAYPHDPWIAKDLFALEVVYLRAQAPEAMSLARRTERWLIRDFPNAEAAISGRRRLGLALGEDQDDLDAPWERFAGDREPPS
jgi:hypothetical protein